MCRPRQRDGENEQIENLFRMLPFDCFSQLFAWTGTKLHPQRISDPVWCGHKATVVRMQLKSG